MESAIRMWEGMTINPLACIRQVAVSTEGRFEMARFHYSKTGTYVVNDLAEAHLGSSSANETRRDNHE
jgi:hypothetical protein